MSSKIWKKRALELAITTKKSWRKIALELGVPKSTVSDYLREVVKGGKLQEVLVKDNAPKILSLDIETSMILARVWGLWKQNVSLSQIVEDWYTICWSAKWLSQEEVINSSVHHFPLPESGEYKDNEIHVIEAIWKLMDEADYIVAYNGKRFDKKKLNAKFLEYNLPEPSPYKIIDPMLVVKGNFALTSNKLDYVAKLLDEEGKNKTNIQLWIDCMNNNVEQLDYMQEYCDEDVRQLENVYLKTRHWDKNHPNLALAYEDNLPRCNGCGSSHLSKLENKTTTTTLSKFEVYRCDDCGKVLRGRTTTLGKDKRKSLLMNAV